MTDHPRLGWNAETALLVLAILFLAARVAFGAPPSPERSVCSRRAFRTPICAGQARAPAQNRSSAAAASAGRSAGHQ